MQSVSPSGRLQLGTELIWNRARESLGGGLFWSAILVILLTFAVAGSTAAAAWVTGIDVITPIALGGAVLLGVLAVLPIPWPAGLGVGAVLAPIVAWNGAAASIHQVHPLDGDVFGRSGISLHPLTIWWSRIVDGSAATDQSFYLFLICLLMWVTGAWLSWCVLRWRKPMIGFIPGAAAFATNLLNFPAEQNGYTLAVLVVTLALLLWSNYSGSIVSANHAHVKLTGDARWDFWESGLVAMAALIVLGIMLPPLSTVDRTLDIESSLFSNWAQLQQRLNHQSAFGHGGGPAGTTGFTTNVSLDAPLVQTKDVVFTYAPLSVYAGPLYFRGVNQTQTSEGEWRYSLVPPYRVAIPPRETPPYAESYHELALGSLDVNMLLPPALEPDILFYPGQLDRVDRQTMAVEALFPKGAAGPLVTIDRLNSIRPPSSAGTYNITVDYSIATDVELRAAGTTYPDWLQPYMTVSPDRSYRPPEVLDAIRKLALQVTANATTPYDKATAIESFLRANYSYTLTPPSTMGRDPIDFFLFSSKRGYCAFFASAMGDMLRSIGIPTRLVSGYGPGVFDSTINRYVVRNEDSHSWVESYFPNYGWITFEPTPSAPYEPLLRGTQGENLCLRDSSCDNPPAIPGGVVGPVRRPTGNTDNPAGGSSTGGAPAFQFHMPDAGTLTKVVAVIVAIVLLLLAAVTRYLRPRTVMAVWKRTLALASLAGAERRPGETPLELGRRLQRTFPEAAEPVGALATGFVVAAYAPPEVASTSRSSVMEAWSALRPMMLRRVFARLRPNRA